MAIYQECKRLRLSKEDHDERGLNCICQPCQRLAEGLAKGLNLNDQWNLWHVCESVLSPSNQNLLNGDLVACLRDMAQEIILIRDAAKPSKNVITDNVYCAFNGETE